MAKITTKSLKAARDLALKGDADAALSALRPMADAGSSAAAASVAELAAFRGDWALVVNSAAKVLGDPSGVFAGNVIDDMVRLLGRAGHEGQPWASVCDAARSALEDLAASEQKPHVKVRLTTIYGRLLAYAERGGTEPHELIGAAARTADAAAYADALEKTGQRIDVQAKPREYLRAATALAVMYVQPEEILRLFDAHGAHGDFSVAVDAARVLCRQGRTDEAWAAITPHLGSWAPVDLAQVAPVVLLTDEDLRRMSSRERNELVLRTPRGSATR